MPSRQIFMCAAILLSATLGFSQQPTIAGVQSHTFSYWAPGYSVTANTATADLTVKTLSAPRVEDVTVHVEAPAAISVYDIGKTPSQTFPFAYTVSTSVKASDPNYDPNGYGPIAYSLST